MGTTSAAAGATAVAAAPAGTAAPAAALSRWLVLGGLVVLGAGALAPGWPSAGFVLAVAGIGLLLGVPHGALDHLLVARLTGRPVLVSAAVYAAVAVLAWCALRFGGPVALWSVLALSVVHFGTGETEVWRTLTPWRPGRTLSALLALAGTGALLLPLARGGDELSAVAAAISPPMAATLADPVFRAVLVVAWGVAAVVGVAAALRAGHRRVAVDLVVVGALGAFAPPLAAFALWFGCWHAVRHTGRLLATDPHCAALVAAGRPGAALRRLAGDAALPTAAALVVLAGLVATTVAVPDPSAALAEVLRVLLALTVPHMVAIVWLDHRRPAAEPAVRPGTPSART